MFESQVLDVVIGIIFLFLLVSIICSSIREGLEAFIKSRGAYLEYGIRELLQDKKGENIAANFFNHPLIFGLFPGGYSMGKEEKPKATTSGKNFPSYIPADNFARTLMDIAARGPKTNVVNSHAQAPAITIESIRMNIANIENPAVQRVLLSAVDTAQGDINKLQKFLEAWYNSAMDRVSGWYKRSTNWVIFLIALAVAVLGNINTIAVINYLSTNETARKEAVGQAATARQNTITTGQQANTKLSSIAWPIGWGKEKVLKKADDTYWWYFAFYGFGWLLTAIAATMGAPFWFDMLNKIMVIRSTVKPHEKSPEEASEDRQLSPKNKQPEQPVQKAEEVPPPVVPSGNGSGNGTLLSTPMDEESEMECCLGTITTFTNDDQLPQAQGGVA